MFIIPAKSVLSSLPLLSFCIASISLLYHSSLACFLTEYISLSIFSKSSVVLAYLFLIFSNCSNCCVALSSVVSLSLLYISNCFSSSVFCSLTVLDALLDNPLLLLLLLAFLEISPIASNSCITFLLFSNFSFNSFSTSLT